MKKGILLLCVAMMAFYGPLQAQEKQSSLTVSLNQDVFFGFYPAVFGSNELNDKLSLTYYGIFWTTPSFGTGGGGGLWTEFGLGVSLDAGPLSISPQIGVLSGKLLSNGVNSMFFDGIVPNLTVDLNHDLLEGQFYLGYYKSILPGEMEGDNGTMADVSSTNDFLHYWANLGIKAGDLFSFGVHWEHLYFAPANIIEADFAAGEEPVGADLYQWIGPYVQFSHADGHALRFVAGPQLVEGAGSTFYKLSASFGF